MSAHREATWDKGLQILLVMIVGFNILPHTVDIPPWTTALAALCLVWKTLTLTRGVSLPNRYLNWLMVGAGCACIFIEYGTILGQEPASAMLVFLASMKLLETNRYRDAMLVIFTSYFLLMAHLLSSQTLLSTIFMGLDVLLITALMFQAHKRDRRTSVRSFRPAMRMLALAIPVWIFLFLAFPRFSAGLWSLNPAQGSGSGFSTNMSPGSVEKLAQDDATAFRVHFLSDNSPSPEALYWRGSVLSDSNGLAWSPGEIENLVPEPLTRPNRVEVNALNYEVWLEPLFHRWLFVLDYPISLTPLGRLEKFGIKRQHGITFSAGRELYERAAYEASSTRLAPSHELDARQRDLYVRAPNETTERVRELARSLLSSAQQNSAAVSPEMKASRAVLEWLDREKFRYTLQPGALRPGTGSEQLDEFLFEHKRGFCEHFAASYGVLMRLMGVPSRVVVGFQGGRVNDLAGYLIVRNLDAHAWNEIWVSDPKDSRLGRWTRVDPTEAIAPLRIQLGGEFNRVDARDIAAGRTREEIQRSLHGGLARLVFRASMVWDAAQMKWNGFLLKYDFDYQKGLFSRLGMEGASRLVFFIWTALGVFVFSISLHVYLRKRALKEDPVLLTWRKFCRTIENAGLAAKRPSEGPLDFSGRAAAGANPESAKVIHELTAAFVELRYGPLSADEARRKLKKFKRDVRSFDPRGPDLRTPPQSPVRTT